MSGINVVTYESAVAVTPSDTAVNSVPFAGLYVGGGGDVTLLTVRKQQVLFKAVPTGTFMRIACVQVFATGTSATNIVGLGQLPYRGTP